MPPSPPTRRCWYQFGLGTMLLLCPLLAVISWQCATWPATDILVFEADSLASMGGPPVGNIYFQRPATPVEITGRVLVWTLACLVACVACRPACRALGKARRWLPS